jgi:hypothetical protein
MSFSGLKAKPALFPKVLQPEVELQRDAGDKARIGTAAGSSSGRRSPTGVKGKEDDKWQRGQTPGLAPGRGVTSMAPQGGRGLFAQAGARAVMADQQRSRDSGPIKPGDRRDDRDRRDGGRDSRGGPRGGGGGGRDGGRGGDRRDDRRGGSSSGSQQPYLEGPVAPLTKSQNRWEVGKASSNEMERIKKRVQGLLNKLALDKFDTLTAQLTDLIVENRNEGIPLLNEVVTIIFDKALSEQFFSSMYADLCVEVSKAVATIPEFEPELAEANQAQAAVDATAAPAPTGEDGAPVLDEAAQAERERQAKLKQKKSPFRIMLLSKCQREFEEGLAPVAGRESMSEEDIVEAEMAQKRRFLGNIRFIGELYKKGMLLEKIMHSQFLARKIERETNFRMSSVIVLTSFFVCLSVLVSSSFFFSLHCSSDWQHAKSCRGGSRSRVSFVDDGGPFVGS